MELVYLTVTGYYIYSIIVGSVTVASSTIYVVHLYRQSSTMMRLVQQSRIVPIVQRGWVRAISSKNLVAGDVVVLTTGRAACDMVGGFYACYLQ